MTNLDRPPIEVHIEDDYATDERRIEISIDIYVIIGGVALATIVCVLLFFLQR